MNKLIQLVMFGILTSTILSCQFSSQNSYEVVSFDEPEAPQSVSPVQKWDELENGVQVAWGSRNQRYHREYIPETELLDNTTVSGWKNERVYAQLVAWTNDSLKDLSIHVSDLKSDKTTIESNAVKYYFVRNVISDEFIGGCGYKTKDQKTAHLVADCLEEAKAINLREKSTRGIWFNIDIPMNAEAGSYSSKITVKADGKKVKTLNLTVNVLNRELPNPKDWKYHLDLWQNPYAVARIHSVELWSEQHFELMQPLYEMLANAGQKCITASVLHKPWGGQTFDPFDSMIKHTLKEDGTWEFDYSIFDKWVTFMMDLGIKKQINCYSLIPWGNQLAYYDEKIQQDTFIVASASSPEYSEYWMPFLKDFKQHVKERGWFEITTIAMDERPLEDMVSAIKLINNHGNFKITSAANYNPGLSEQIHDLSVAFGHTLPKEVLNQRNDRGQVTTFYVCCSEAYPNNFTFSPPAEGVWQGWFAFANNLDGFLRWAYNSWVENPMQDTRFRTWPAGDTFFVYPGAKSSIRFEKLREGIQDYEKLQILSTEFKNTDTTEAKNKLFVIEKLLQEFNLESIEKEGALAQISKARTILNSL